MSEEPGKRDAPSGEEGGALVEAKKQRTDAAAKAREQALGTAVERLEAVKKQLQRVQALFKDPEATQFVVVTIATELAMSESERLVKALDTQGVRVSALVVNQLVDTSSPKFVSAKRRDQSRALALVAEDARLQKLRTQLAALTDREMRGLGGLDYFGRTVWEAHVPHDLTAGVASKSDANEMPLIDTLVAGRRAGAGGGGGEAEGRGGAGRGAQRAGRSNAR